MPARGLLSRLMVRSSTFLSLWYCAKMCTCKNLLFLFFDSPFIDWIQQQFSCVAVPFLWFVSNSQVGPNGPRRHTKLSFQCFFPFTRNILTDLCFTPCTLARCDLCFTPCTLARCDFLINSCKYIEDDWFQVLIWCGMCLYLCDLCENDYFLFDFHRKVPKWVENHLYVWPSGIGVICLI